MFWPVAVLLAVVLAIQTVRTGQYKVRGHAAGHLSSATTIFSGSFARRPACSRG